MLDAAEALLAEGGPDALTVEAVVRRAGASTGSFYARFGDRGGLLASVQDRFFTRLEAFMTQTLATPRGARPLEAVLQRLTDGFLALFAERQASFFAFLVHGRADPAMRARGHRASMAAARFVRGVLEPHAGEIAPEMDTAAETVYRVLLALGQQVAMFRADELTDSGMTQEALARQTVQMLRAYLRGESR